MSNPTSGVDAGPVTAGPGRRAARRLDGVGSTIFAEMSALAVRTGSVNPGPGFPDPSVRGSGHGGGSRRAPPVPARPRLAGAGRGGDRPPAPPLRAGAGAGAGGG